MENQNTIRVKAMCLLIQDGKVLVADGKTYRSLDKDREVVPGDFYRVIGGGLNFDESAEEAVRREVREEIGVEIKDLTFLEVIEQRYVYGDKKYHDITFLFKGVPEPIMDTSKNVHVVENTYEGYAVWVPISELLSTTKPFYPETDYSKFLKQ